MGCEQPAQVACRDAEARSERRLRTVVKSAVEDHSHRPTDELRPVPWHERRSAVGPATQAGPEARRLGCCRVPEREHVLGVRLCAASRPAVDACRHDRRKRLHDAGIARAGPLDRTDSDRRIRGPRPDPDTSRACESRGCRAVRMWPVPQYRLAHPAFCRVVGVQRRKEGEMKTFLPTRPRVAIGAALGALLLLVLAATSAGGASGARALGDPPEYEVQERGTFGSWAIGASINNRSWVAGQAAVTNGDVHAALWQFGSITDLGTFGGPGTNSAVLWPVKNEHGVISGVAETDELNPLGEIWSCGWFFTQARRNCFGFVWRNGEKRPLDTLGGFKSFATGTKRHAQTVGWAETDGREPSCTPPQQLQFLAVIWGPGENDLHPLSPLSGDETSAATAINDRGEVVGISGSCDRAFGRFSAEHMVLWRQGVPIQIRDHGGVAWNTPMAINRRGDVVGFANRSAADGGSFRPRAFLSTKPGRINDLGALGTDPFSQALGITEDRQVVGVSYSADFSTCKAFLWKRGRMTDLNDLAPEYSGQLCSANDIDDRGRITGQAFEASTGQTVAFVASPGDGGGDLARLHVRPGKKPAAPWAALRDVMTRSGVRPEDIGR